MRIAVTGSIAIDHLMEYPGRFADRIVAEELDNVSLSFLVDHLNIRRGGVAANIAFGLARLGMNPILVGAIGTDFGEYRTWLERHGVDTKSLHISRTRQTARFLCTTDRDQKQFATFYAGAMVEARDIRLRDVVDRTNGLDLVIISPNDPEAMTRHTAECRTLNIPFVADPSQQLARLSGSEIRDLVDGAALLFTNQYEASLLMQMTGWSAREVIDRVGHWITTHGSRGVRIASRDRQKMIEIHAVETSNEADPTGVGDAFRAGFLWGLHARMSMERAAQLGCTVATINLEQSGSQEYSLDRSDLSNRLAKAYGGDIAAEIESKLRVPKEVDLESRDPSHRSSRPEG